MRPATDSPDKTPNLSSKHLRELLQAALGQFQVDTNRDNTLESGCLPFFVTLKIGNEEEEFLGRIFPAENSQHGAFVTLARPLYASELEVLIDVIREECRKGPTGSTMIDYDFDLDSLHIVDSDADSDDTQIQHTFECLEDDEPVREAHTIETTIADHDNQQSVVLEIGEDPDLLPRLLEALENNTCNFNESSELIEVEGSRCGKSSTYHKKNTRADWRS